MTLIPKAKWLPITMLVVSILGFADATYLSVKHFTGENIPCTITHGCDVVTKSAYSEILGIPVALLGSAFYLTVFALVFLAMDNKNMRLLRYAGLFTIVGFGASLWFLAAQAFLIRAFCQWCLVSAATSTVLFALGFVLLPLVLKKEELTTSSV